RIVSLPDEVLAQADMSTMVTLIANAAPVPYALKEEIIGKLGDGFLYEVYGSTELGIDIKIVKDDGTVAGPTEPGELFVRTNLAMDGYYHTEEQLTELDDDQWKS